MPEITCEFEGLTFTDADVVDIASYIPEGEYNPHNVAPFIIYSQFGVLAVVFASNAQDALDAAVDANKMESCRVCDADLDKMDDDEREELAYLGNAGEAFDLAYVGIKKMPNPRYSWCALFKAAQAD